MAKGSKKCRGKQQKEGKPKKTKIEAHGQAFKVSHQKPTYELCKKYCYTDSHGKGIN